MLSAFRRKDPSFDGTFVVAVRPRAFSAARCVVAKPARAENSWSSLPRPTRRFGTGTGRATCRRPAFAAGVAAAADGTCRGGPATPVREADLRARDRPGDGPQAFPCSLRDDLATYQPRAEGRGRDRRRPAAAPAAEAMVRAGFESPSGFREAVSKLTGATPRSLSRSEPLLSMHLWTPLGRMVKRRGTPGWCCWILPTARVGRGHSPPRNGVRRGGRPAAVIPGEHSHLRRLAGELEAYFPRALRDFTAPLDPRGTPFRRRAWDYLLGIPYGETRTYGEQAAAIGRAGPPAPSAARTGRTLVHPGPLPPRRRGRRGTHRVCGRHRASVGCWNTRRPLPGRGPGFAPAGALRGSSQSFTRTTRCCSRDRSCLQESLADRILSDCSARRYVRVL